MIRILHLSDPHFGACDPEVADAFLQNIRDKEWDHTILSGDLTMRARRREYDESRRFIASLPRPLVVIPGNHDIPAFNQPVDRFFNPFRRYRKAIDPDLEPRFTDSRIRIRSLNSSRAFGLHADWSDGFLSKRQLDGIRTGFADVFRLKILVLHHPLIAPTGHQRSVVKPLPGLLDAIATAKVDLVLCGHFHLSRIATAGIMNRWHCIVSQAPTVCSTRLQGEPQGYHEIISTEGKLSIVLHQFDGITFTPASSFEFSKTESGWKDCGFQQSGEVVSPG